MVSAEENAYEILGLPQGPAATGNEIKKASLKFPAKIAIEHPLYSCKLSSHHFLSSISSFKQSTGLS
jgi:hypothetical protein